MDDFILFGEKDILERVDEYSLYCFYLSHDVVIGGHSIAPTALRIGKKDDDSPSFGVFVRKFGGDRDTEFLWKDLGTGKHGDIFELVKTLFGYVGRFEAVKKIQADFGLGGESDGILPPTLGIKKRIYAESAVNIEVASRPFNKSDLIYWKQFNINEAQLNRYNTTAIKHYWLTDAQKVPKYPSGLGYAYRIFNKYQLYFPHAKKENKFRTTFNEVCVPGFLQLQHRNNLCIITKSMKDVMCIDSFGFDVIGVRSENTVLTPECIVWLKNKYKRILVLFDNDMKHKGDAYEFEKIYVPLTKPTDKDASDFCKNHGPEACFHMLRQITKT